MGTSLFCAIGYVSVIFSAFFVTFYRQCFVKTDEFQVLAYMSYDRQNRVILVHIIEPVIMDFFT